MAVFGRQYYESGTALDFYPKEFGDSGLLRLLTEPVIIIIGVHNRTIALEKSDNAGDQVVISR